jgi:hypothetical protein
MRCAAARPPSAHLARSEADRALRVVARESGPLVDLGFSAMRRARRAPPAAAPGFVKHILDQK